MDFKIASISQSPKLPIKLPYKAGDGRSGAGEFALYGFNFQLQDMLDHISEITEGGALQAQTQTNDGQSCRGIQGNG